MGHATKEPAVPVKDALSLVSNAAVLGSKIPRQVPAFSNGLLDRNSRFFGGWLLAAGDGEVFWSLECCGKC